MRVFVLEPTEYSMFKAKRFGTLVFLFSDESEHAPWYDEQFLLEVENSFKARGFRPEVDVIAVSGKMIDVNIMVSVAMKIYEEPIRLLCFDHDKEVRDFRQVVVA